MKTLCSLSLFLSCLITQAQPLDNLAKDKQLKNERLLSQANTQMKTGSILLAAGYTSAAIGLFTALEYGYILDEWPPVSTVLFVSGTAAVVTGWCFFVSGVIKKKKAKTQLRLMTSQMKINNRSYIAQPSIGITFKF